MAYIRLSKRLAAIAQLIPENCAVADVGTDHGYIPVFLCQRGANEPIFAADINPEPLRRAAETAAQYGFSEKITLVLCDGLEAFSGDKADCAVIAGMGGETIINILQNAPWTDISSKTVVLQPMSKSAELRQWLFENGWLVTCEKLVEDGRLYELFCAVGGRDEPYSAAELHTGHTALISSSPHYLDRLNELEEKAHRAREGLSRAQDGDAAVRKAELDRLVSQLSALKAGGEK